MWLCKTCGFKAEKRTELLRHYRLKHGIVSHGQTVPCLYTDCPCSFKTFNALQTHLSRQHPDVLTTNKLISFQCVLCSSGFFNSESQYFEHLGSHLRRFEVVACVFQNCSFSTNIYSTFATHRHRKHSPHCLDDFKTEILKKYPDPAVAQHEPLLVADGEDPGTSFEEDPGPSIEKEENFSQDIKEKFGRLFLKLESTFNVPNRCIDEIVDELQFISYNASAPVLKDVIECTLRTHNCDMDMDLVENLSKNYPISSAFARDGSFSTPYKRRQFLKEHFSVVEPKEYILDEKECKTFQYVPILQLLLQVLNNKNIQERISETDRTSVRTTQYSSFKDGRIFQKNVFFCEEDRIRIILYIDDFEVCNPLGTSRKKHKITAVYWMLGNIPSQGQSTLTSIYLAVLCKAVDTKTFGYEKILEPLLTDLRTLERDGLFVPSLKKM